MCNLIYCIDWVHSYIEKWVKYTQCLNCFTKINSILFHNLTREKFRYYVLAKIICLFVLILVIEKWFKQIQCVRSLTNIYSGCFTISQGNKVDTMYELSSCVDLVYIWSLKSDLIKHTVLSVSWRFILVGP